MPNWPAEQLPISLAAATLWAVGLAVFSTWLRRRTEATIADWI